MRGIGKAFLAAGAASLSSVAVADSPGSWTTPTEPFHIAGPIYYVGTEGIGVYLLRTTAGLIVIDSGPKEAAPIVERNIAKLGLNVSDVKLLLETHAHWDHVAGMARLKRDTGARFLASAADRKALENGSPTSDTDYGVVRFDPVKVDGLVTDGVPVRLGDVTLTPVLTPGHTPGCTSWLTTVQDQGRNVTAFFPCSFSVAGNKLFGNRGFPQIVSSYRSTFAKVSRVKADIVLPGHPELADVLPRGKRQREGKPNAFVDPGLLPRFVAEFQADFDDELAKQRRQSTKAH